MTDPKKLNIKELKDLLRANNIKPKGGISRLKKVDLFRLAKRSKLFEPSKAKKATSKIGLSSEKKEKIKELEAKIKELDEIIKFSLDVGEGVAPDETSLKVVREFEDEKESLETKLKDIEKSTQKALQPHQKLFIEHFIKGPARGALAIHGVGSGKTLTAVVASQRYLKEKPCNKVVVITPASLLTNFQKELYEYDPRIKNDKRYKFFTYDGYSNAYKRNDEDTDCENALMIVDEGQNLRTPIRFKTGTKILKSGAKVYNILEGCGLTADKILILSATPMVNSPQDIENLLAIINGHLPLSTTFGDKAFDKLWSDPKLLARYFGCRLSFFKHSGAVRDKFFPKVREIEVPITMSESTEKLYNQVEKAKISDKKLLKQFSLTDDADQNKLSAFHSGLRKASNALNEENSPKVNFIIRWVKAVVNQEPDPKVKLTKAILDKRTDKIVIFTHFKGAGTDLIAKRLKEEKIPFGLIDGSVSRVNRQKIVDKYVSGDIKVIMISKAGAEGLNLLETGYIILVEPSWNITEMEQVKGRGIRFKSHINLPEKKRNVLILQLFLIKKSEKKNFKKLVNAWKSDKDLDKLIKSSTSIDLQLWNKAHQKQKVIDDALKELQKTESLEECKSDKEFLDVESVLGEVSIPKKKGK